MNSTDFGFHKVTPDVFTCVADADTRAVMGAKTSRAPDLEKRWGELMETSDYEDWEWGDPPAAVKDFLDKNLKEYMHSSIAEMAEVFVHGRRLGWPSTWLITDNPLFVGQEVSTRAVDMTKGDLAAPCKYSDPSLADLHRRWVEFFTYLRTTYVFGRGYKFDDVRWALPGTTQSGITICNKVRDGVRNLEQIQGLGGVWAEMASELLLGFKAYAPRATEAVMRGPRTPKSYWSPELVQHTATRAGQDEDVFISVNKWEDAKHNHPRREKPNTYLDPAWSHFGQFKVTIRCSVAIARDWHRHRAVMPWSLSVPVDPSGLLLKASKYYNMSEIPKGLWEDTSKAFHALYAVDPWQALHALPFGTVVEMTGLATLPDLLYMLELRYSSDGANAEYRAQARQGLEKLAYLLGPSLTDRINILGCLDGEPEPSQLNLGLPTKPSNLEE